MSKKYKPYNPSDTEATIYMRWERSGYFNPDKCLQKGVCESRAEAFSIVLPPPNVTGNLHIGHSAMLAIEDALIRYNRMRGKKTLWIPGTDHASIATQSKVEKMLFERDGKTKHDLGREEFLRQVEQYAKDSHDTIISQTKKMGASLDWSREAYTLDQGRSLAVRTAFKKMYDLGLIYRGNRIVNWDPKLQTTVSDDEVEYVDSTTPLYYLKYGPFEIATARPETKFGDKYVVMHPDDTRYREYNHQDKIKLEWINGEVEATIIKDEVIDMEFGTGVMTITPWHDATDFALSETHNLDKEQIIDEQGKLLKIAGEFEGMDILEARPKIVEKLEEKGLLVRVDNEYSHRIAINSRGGGVIEPQIKEQWFVAVTKEIEDPRGGAGSTTLKAIMKEAVESGQVNIMPERFTKTYYHWIDNLRDWCISRQLWFGHRIPIWYRGEEIYCDITPPEGADWEQETDTLDTWFSSGLWTFSTLGWPEKTEDLETFHPTSVLETGYDIIFFWVARMILMSGLLMGEVPFKTVYLHGLVRDEQNRKMSKSLDNAIDPLEFIEKYGADSLRCAFIFGTGVGNDMVLGEDKVKGMRNFANKVFNIGRFIQINVEGKVVQKELAGDLGEREQTLINAHYSVVESVTESMEEYRLSDALQLIYEFMWHILADEYLESVKEDLKSEANWEGPLSVLIKVYVEQLKLLHPFMPFITEEMYGQISELLGSEEREFLMVSSWPKRV